MFVDRIRNKAKFLYQNSQYEQSFILSEASCFLLKNRVFVERNAPTCWILRSMFSIYMQTTLSKFSLVLFNALSSQQTQRPLRQSLPPVVRAKTWAAHLTRNKWSHLVTLLPQQCRRLLLTAHHLDQMIQWPRVRSKWRHISYFCICSSLTSLIIISVNCWVPLS